MAAVVDLGCFEHGYEQCDSMGELMRAYYPSVFYGFDPHPEFREVTFVTAGTKLVLRRQAAWLFDGEVGYEQHETGSRIGDGEMVPCFDFSLWLLRNGPAVVKMDIEGSEYELLERMYQHGSDLHVSELLVEWHGADARKDELLGKLRCPVREWWL